MKKILMIGGVAVLILAMVVIKKKHTEATNAAKIPVVQAQDVQNTQMNHTQHMQHTQNMQMNQMQHGQNMPMNGTMRDGMGCAMMGNMTSNTDATPARN